MMSDTPQMPKEEVLYRDESTPEAGKRAKWRRERRKVLLMKILVRKFSRAGVGVMEFCAGTRTTEEARMLLEKHGKLSGCGVDSEMLTADEAGFFVSFRSQLLNPKCDNGDSRKVKPVKNAFREGISAFLASKPPFCGICPLGWVLCKS